MTPPRRSHGRRSPRANAGERYLVGRDRLTTREYFEIIADASGVPLPGRTIGKHTTLTLARLMSAAAKITGRPPLMAYDLMATVYRRSLLFDGSKAERDLGLRYTPVESGLRDAVAEILGRRVGPRSEGVAARP